MDSFYITIIIIFGLIVFGPGLASKLTIKYEEWLNRKKRNV